jgi:hypothetical protein
VEDNPCHLAMFQIAEESSFADELSPSVHFKVFSTTLLDVLWMTGWQPGW